eukprot:Gregarina_sp_Poly_1__3935@NODE_2180_length_2542_cov_105_294949_g1405_i0_p1_GENE_NODE_2180_length_2542_cov_105_294949_g1405_i0NODE_2180_length_2542_cov_105_294949_g1405_i0_p1_ORF_typecomplete_len330_score47_78EthD/PF07110_11/0_13_NODE_2180_length_2542_cov_105_294949_g1405_i015512489
MTHIATAAAVRLNWNWHPKEPWLLAERAMGWTGFANEFAGLGSLKVLLPLEELAPEMEDHSIVKATGPKVAPLTCSFLDQIHTGKLVQDQDKEVLERPSPEAQDLLVVEMAEELVLLSAMTVKDYDIVEDAVDVSDESQQQQQLAANYRVDLSRYEILPMAWWELTSQALASAPHAFLQLQRALGFLPLPERFLETISKKELTETLSHTNKYVKRRPDGHRTATWTMHQFDRCIYKVFPTWEDLKPFMTAQDRARVASQKEQRQHNYFIVPPRVIHQEKIVAPLLKIIPEIVKVLLGDFKAEPVLYGRLALL